MYVLYKEEMEEYVSSAITTELTEVFNFVILVFKWNRIKLTILLMNRNSKLIASQWAELLLNL